MLEKKDGLLEKLRILELIFVLTEVIPLGVHGLPQEKSNFDVAL
jgi:hypothetical protein